MEPRYSNFSTFQGISVDANVAYRNACQAAIRYLTRFGYTDEQIYLLLAAAPVDGRIASIVDIPNACCTLSIPTEIFSFDIRPEATMAENVKKKSRRSRKNVMFKIKGKTNKKIVNEALAWIDQLSLIIFEMGMLHDVHLEDQCN